MSVEKVHPMFLRVLKTRPATPVAPVPTHAPADETLDYYSRTAPEGPLREITALEQHYGYWSRE